MSHFLQGLLRTVNVCKQKGSSTKWNMDKVKYVMKNRVYFVDVSLQNRVYFFRVYFFRVYFFEFIFLGPSLFFKKPSLFFWNRVYFKKNRAYFQKMLWKINSLLRPSLKNKLRVYFKNKLAPSTFENFEINSIFLKINLENKLFSEGLGYSLRFDR